MEHFDMTETNIKMIMKRNDTFDAFYAEVKKLMNNFKESYKQSIIMELLQTKSPLFIEGSHEMAFRIYWNRNKMQKLSSIEMRFFNDLVEYLEKDYLKTGQMYAYACSWWLRQEYEEQGLDIPTTKINRILDRCVKKGWLSKESNPSHTKYFLIFQKNNLVERKKLLPLS